MRLFWKNDFEKIFALLRAKYMYKNIDYLLNRGYFDEDIV